jgi:hypothetical protein
MKKVLASGPLFKTSNESTELVGEVVVVAESTTPEGEVVYDSSCRGKGKAMVGGGNPLFSRNWEKVFVKEELN